MNNPGEYISPRNAAQIKDVEDFGWAIAGAVDLAMDALVRCGLHGDYKMKTELFDFMADLCDYDLSHVDDQFKDYMVLNYTSIVLGSQAYIALHERLKNGWNEETMAEFEARLRANRANRLSLVTAKVANQNEIAARAAFEPRQPDSLGE